MISSRTGTRRRKRRSDTQTQNFRVWRRALCSWPFFHPLLGSKYRTN